MILMKYSRSIADATVDDGTIYQYHTLSSEMKKHRLMVYNEKLLAKAGLISENDE